MLYELQEKYSIRGKVPKTGVPRIRGMKIERDHVFLKHFQGTLGVFFVLLDVAWIFRVDRPAA